MSQARIKRYLQAAASPDYGSSLVGGCSNCPNCGAGFVGGAKPKSVKKRYCYTSATGKQKCKNSYPKEVKAAKSKNEWIQYVSEVAKINGIPYAQALVDPGVKRGYKEWKTNKGPLNPNIYEKHVVPAKKRGRKPKAQAGSGLSKKKVGGIMAAKSNPWIQYLKEIEARTGIPYGNLMQDPAIREGYHMEMGHY
jgi:hypothetical protein